MPNEPANSPLLRFPGERAAIVRETARRAFELEVKKGDPEYILNDACLKEISRLAEGSSIEEVRDFPAWRRLWRSLGSLDRPALLRELEGLILDYAEDVAGGFRRSVYELASRVVPPALELLLDPKGVRGLPQALLSGGADKLLAQRLRVEGPLEHLQRLAQTGTLVCVPTHLSNLDSPVMGYALQLGGLPPTTYGAGKNLFTNPVLGFFMRNCGAYRVDRRIRHELYKDVLKTYSQVILERGYHSMFFPGGTRSRSGRVEDHLKLGLLGTALPATVARFRRAAGLESGPAVPPMYIVPATINLQLVLEAETLIADYLKEAGKARYIIEDDESAQWQKVLHFARSLIQLDGAIVVRFCPPMDVLGNPVDEEGRSLDPHGREVDLSRYFLVGGAPQAAPQRDAEYMRDTGEAISASYRKNTRLMSTHLLAHVMWRRICQALPALDLFRRLRQPLSLRLPEAEALSDLDRLRDVLRERGHLLGPGADGPAPAVLESALSAFRSYHAEPAVLRETDTAPGGPVLVPGDRQVLYYYQNRVESLGVSP